MNEAKTLVHMAISVMIGAMILAAAAGLITVGYSMWSMFSKQDLANRRLRDYSTYSAFDNAIVRGQEVVALIADTEGDPFIAVYKYAGEHESYTKYSEPEIYFNTYTANEVLNYKDNYYKINNALADKCFKDLVGDSSTSPDKPLVPAGGGSRITKNFSDTTLSNRPTFKTLQEDFVARASHKDSAGNVVLGYARYYSVLIYDHGSSTDIIGILLVEQPPI